MNGPAPLRAFSFRSIWAGLVGYLTTLCCPKDRFMARAPIKSSSNSEVAERIKPVMDAVTERIHYAESRRTNYSVMAGVLVAAGITILTFALGAIDSTIIRFAAVFAAVAMVGTGLVVIWVFGQQTNRYPFTSATKTWKWFYRDALDNSGAFEISPWRYVAWGKSKARVEGEYSRQLPLFKTNMLKLSDADVSVDQDIQQLYTLHVTEYYKNIFLKHLRVIFNRGLIVIVVAAAAGSAFGWNSDQRAHEIKSYALVTGQVKQSLRSRLLSSPISSDAVFVVEAKVKNGSKQAVTWQTMVAVDEHGWPLPIEATYPLGHPPDIAPGTEQLVVANVKMRRDVAEAVRGFRVRLK